MNLSVQAVGIFALGLFVGYVCWYFVVRIALGEVSVETLSAVLGVVAGGVVIKILDKHLAAPKTDVWWYPIGLVAGFVLYVLFWFINAKTPGGNTPPVPADGPNKGKVFPTALGLFKL